jgi:hypothetical protein
MKGFVYDIIDNIKHPTKLVEEMEDELLSIELNVTALNWIRVSPLGNYLVVQFAGNPDEGEYTYDLDMNYIGHLTRGDEHGDFAVDESGVEWFIDYNHNSGNPFSGPYVIKSRLPDGYDDYLAGDETAMSIILKVSWHFGDHISCLSYRKGWCVITTRENSGQPWEALEGEVIKVYLDSTEEDPHIERLCHHRSDQYYARDNCDPEWAGWYWTSPHATTNRDGSKIMYGSNWEENCFSEAYVIDLFTSEQPSNCQIKNAYWEV